MLILTPFLFFNFECYEINFIFLFRNLILLASFPHLVVRCVGSFCRTIERKFSEQNIGAPPSYEEAVGVSRSPTYSDRYCAPQILIYYIHFILKLPNLFFPSCRDGEAPAASAPQSSPPTVNAALQSSSPVTNSTPQSSSPANIVNPIQVTPENGVPSHPNMEADAFDEFDPRGSVPGTQ